MLRLDPNEKLKLDEQDSILPNSTLTLPKTMIELPSKSYVDSRLIVPSNIRNNALVDFNNKILDNVRCIKVISFPAFPEHLAAKNHVDQAIYFSVDESCLLRLDPDEKINLKEKDSIVLNSTLKTPQTIIELPTKSYVDSLHEINRNRRNLSSVFND